MWEAIDNYSTDDFDVDVVTAGVKKTRKHLSRVVDVFLDRKVPTCIAVQLCSKRLKFSDQTEFLNECSKCGFNFLTKDSFTLQTKDVKDARLVKATCRGCGAKLNCGKLPQVQDFRTSSFESVETDAPMLSTSNISSRNQGTSKIPSLPNSKNSKKRKGSALERLLKKQESEADRSLSGFLSHFASQ